MTWNPNDVSRWKQDRWDEEQGDFFDVGQHKPYQRTQKSSEEQATEWLAEGKCPKCGEDMEFVAFALKCSVHGLPDA